MLVGGVLGLQIGPGLLVLAEPAVYRIAFGLFLVSYAATCRSNQRPPSTRRRCPRLHPRWDFSAVRRSRSRDPGALLGDMVRLRG